MKDDWKHKTADELHTVEEMSARLGMGDAACRKLRALIAANALPVVDLGKKTLFLVPSDVTRCLRRDRCRNQHLLAESAKTPKQKPE